MELLRGLTAIAVRFGTSKKIINGWIAEGAPIFCVGKTFQCAYESLVRWLEINRLAKKHNSKKSVK